MNHEFTLVIGAFKKIGIEQFIVKTSTKNSIAIYKWFTAKHTSKPKVTRKC